MLLSTETHAIAGRTIVMELIADAAADFPMGRFVTWAMIVRIVLSESKVRPGGSM